MADELVAVVMAGGLGTRMRGATPKHLHPLLGRRMVDWVVLAARAAGADPVVVVTSPEARDVFAGRESKSETFHDASWVFAVSQLLAFLAAIFAFLFLWIAIGAVVIFVLAALFFIFVDRR